MDLLRPEQFSVEAENDIVIFRVGSGIARFSYFTASAIAQGLRVAGGTALRSEGVIPTERFEMKRDLPAAAVEAAIAAPPFHDDRRNTSSPGTRWAVALDGALVRFNIGNVSIAMEANTALTLGNWMRVRAREAKRWAGDTGRVIRMSGVLTDAAANYRSGHA